MSMGLTPRQRELMIYIQTRDEPPSTLEMMDAMRASGTSRIWELLNALEERGYIARRRDSRGRALHRSIKVLRRIEPKYRFLTIDQARAEARQGAM